MLCKGLNTKKSVLPQAAPSHHKEYHDQSQGGNDPYKNHRIG